MSLSDAGIAQPGRGCVGKLVTRAFRWYRLRLVLTGAFGVNRGGVAGVLAAGGLVYNPRGERVPLSAADVSHAGGGCVGKPVSQASF